MANKKKEKASMNIFDLVEEIALRKSFAKKDVKQILDGLKEVVEDCVKKGIDVDIKGLIHISIKNVSYKKTPGIVKFHGVKNFKSETKRVVYQVPQNIKNICKKEGIN